jgi:AGCS family alanine or glycine:cation symporter
MLEKINSFVWGNGLLFLILGTGLFFSIKLRFFQIFRFGEILNKTFLSLFRNSKNKYDKSKISPLQSLSTALSATMGTGNIIGVASAIAIGGAGAVFWLWISALLGMMTVYAENYLGTLYRYQNNKGEWIGGASAYIEKGLNCRPLAVVFCIFCILSSFGMGNMAQINAISDSFHSAFSLNPLITGIVTAVLIFSVTCGGVKRLGKVTQLIIPFLSAVYILSALIIIFINYTNIPSVFHEIFTGAFGIKAVGGGISGNIIKKSINIGLRRGVFSNEAGLGSSGMLHSASAVENPHIQGMWGIFEVFADTIVCCTLTALVILANDNINENIQGSSVIIDSFSPLFNNFSGFFISVSIALFAFATLLGWSYCGECAVRYCTGEKGVFFYRIIFALVIIAGAVIKAEYIWTISDIFNGLMAFPNLTAILLLSHKIKYLNKPR